MPEGNLRYIGRNAMYQKCPLFQEMDRFLREFSKSMPSVI